MISVSLDIDESDPMDLDDEEGDESDSMDLVNQGDEFDQASPIVPGGPPIYNPATMQLPVSPHSLRLSPHVVSRILRRQPIRLNPRRHEHAAAATTASLSSEPDFGASLPLTSAAAAVVSEEDDDIRQAIAISLAPTGNEAPEMHELLRQRIRDAGLRQVDIPLYGNCLFEALLCAAEPGEFVGETSCVLDTDRLETSGFELRCAFTNWIPYSSIVEMCGMIVVFPSYNLISQGVYYINNASVVEETTQIPLFCFVL